MRKPGFFAASVTTAASATTAVSGSNSKIQNSREDCVCNKRGDNSSSEKVPSAEKFAPRFDGLRFIETLVTAHR